MADEEFEALLARLPEMAKAVNAFTAPEIQRAAFEALLAALTDDSPGSSPLREGSDTATGNKPPANRPRKTAPARKTATVDPTKPRSKRAAPTGPFKVDKELNLVPKGKRSFKDFVAVTQPKNQVEQCLVAAYWLTHEVGEESTTGDRVFTCFRDAAWPIPANLSNKLSVAGTKNYLSSTKRDDIRVSINGVNFVEHTMLKRPAAI